MSQEKQLSVNAERVLLPVAMCFACLTKVINTYPGLSVYYSQYRKLLLKSAFKPF
ncbi:hypothetical protein Tsp_10432 [Trichinella spiralis]|uniref:hypothetical protein n=1 Tax=Trichinella spiralis TaxID=6334 RepID=UPI0001EFEC6E|nr:hypothetical protein Tsp_10432 [Trichinella spiralis]